MISEVSALPPLDNLLTIPGTLVDEFRRKGHTLIPGLLTTDELEAYRPAILRAAERQNTEKRRLEDRDTYGKAFLQIMNLWTKDEQVKRFTLAKRFASVAAQLLGVENVRIYHDQALFKEAGGGPTPWHQDQYYWPVDTYKTVTMWMPLVDIHDGMGMLTFASGSHAGGNVFDYEISDESEAAFDQYVAKQGYEISRPAAMHAGDATWHYGYTIHSAPGNLSQRMREVMTIIYVADGATIVQPRNRYQEADLATWIENMPVGAPVASSLNPLVL